MIEFAIGPQNCVVAGFASRRETRRGVGYRRGRIVVVGLVAGHAGPAREIGAELRIMATVALQRRICMRVSQLETGCGVIELTVGPHHRIVTVRASRRESHGDVIHRRDCIVVVGLVAVHAGATGDVVVAKLRVVATSALQRWIGVAAGQQKTSRGVIEFTVGPHHRIVAGLARGREAGLDVIHWSDCVVVIGLVAVRARPTGNVVVAELRVMATGALQWRIRVGVR